MLLQGETNYSAVDALKEFIDNSIRALQLNECPVIRIFFDIDNDTLWIMDNGTGMANNSVHKWLVQGQHSRSNIQCVTGPLHLEWELGKYGVGGKSSMFALGNVIEVETKYRGETSVSTTKVDRAVIEVTRKFDCEYGTIPQQELTNKQKCLVEGYGTRATKITNWVDESFFIVKIKGLTAKTKGIFTTPVKQAVQELKSDLISTYQRFLDPNVNENNPAIQMMLDVKCNGFDDMQSNQTRTKNLWSMLLEDQETYGQIPSYVAEYGNFSKPPNDEKIRGRYEVEYEIDSAATLKKPVRLTIVATYLPKREVHDFHKAGLDKLLPQKTIDTYWKGRLLKHCKSVKCGFTNYKQGGPDEFMYDRLRVSMYLNSEFTPSTSKQSLASNSSDDNLQRIVNGEVQVRLKQKTGSKKLISTGSMPYNRTAFIDELALITVSKSDLVTLDRTIKVRERSYKSLCLYNKDASTSSGGVNTSDTKEDYTDPKKYGSDPKTFHSFLRNMHKYDQDLTMINMSNQIKFLNDHVRDIDGFKNSKLEEGNNEDGLFSEVASFTYHNVEIQSNTNVRCRRNGGASRTVFDGTMLLLKICCIAQLNGIPDVVYLIGKQLVVDETKNDMVPGELVCKCMKMKDAKPSMTVEILTEEDRRNIFEESFGCTKVLIGRTGKLNQNAKMWNSIFGGGSASPRSSSSSSSSSSDSSSNSSSRISLSEAESIVSSLQLQVHLTKRNGDFYKRDRGQSEKPKALSKYKVKIKVYYQESNQEEKKELYSHKNISYVFATASSKKAKWHNAIRFPINFDEMKKGSHKALSKPGIYTFEVTVFDNGNQIGETKISEVTVAMAECERVNIQWEKNIDTASFNVGEILKHRVHIDCFGANNNQAMLSDDQLKILYKSIDLKVHGFTVILNQKAFTLDETNRSRISLNIPLKFNKKYKEKFTDIPFEGKASEVDLAFKGELEILETHQLKCLVRPGKPNKCTLQKDISHCHDGGDDAERQERFPVKLPLGSAVPNIYVQYRDLCGNIAINLSDEELTVDLSCSAFISDNDDDGNDDGELMQSNIKSNEACVCEFMLSDRRIISSPGNFSWQIDMNEDDDDGALQLVDGVDIVKGKIDVTALMYSFVVPDHWKKNIDYIQENNDDHLTIIVQNGCSVDGLSIEPEFLSYLSNTSSSQSQSSNFAQIEFQLERDDENWQSAQPFEYDETTGRMKIPTIPGTIQADRVTYKITTENNNDPKHFHVQTQSDVAATFAFDKAHIVLQSYEESSALKLNILDKHDNPVTPTAEVVENFLNKCTVTCKSIVFSQADDDNKLNLRYEISENVVYVHLTPCFEGRSPEDTHFIGSGLPVKLIITTPNELNSMNVDKQVWVTCGKPKYFHIKDPVLEHDSNMVQKDNSNENLGFLLQYDANRAILSDQYKKRFGDKILDGFKLVLKDRCGTIIKGSQSALYKASIVCTGRKATADQIQNEFNEDDGTLNINDIYYVPHPDDDEGETRTYVDILIYKVSVSEETQIGKLSIQIAKKKWEMPKIYQLRFQQQKLNEQISKTDKDDELQLVAGDTMNAMMTLHSRPMDFWEKEEDTNHFHSIFPKLRIEIHKFDRSGGRISSTSKKAELEVVASDQYAMTTGGPKVNRYLEYGRRLFQNVGRYRIVGNFDMDQWAKEDYENFDYFIPSVTSLDIKILPDCPYSLELLTLNDITLSSNSNHFDVKFQVLDQYANVYHNDDNDGDHGDHDDHDDHDDHERQQQYFVRLELLPEVEEEDISMLSLTKTIFRVEKDGLVQERKLEVQNIGQLKQTRVNVRLKCSLVRKLSSSSSSSSSSFSTSSSSSTSSFSDSSPIDYKPVDGDKGIIFINVTLQDQDFQRTEQLRQNRIKQFKSNIQQRTKEIAALEDEVGELYRILQDDDPNTDLETYFEDEAPDILNTRTKYDHFRQMRNNKHLYLTPEVNLSVSSEERNDDKFIAAGFGEIFAVDCPDAQRLFSMMISNMYNTSQLIIMKNGYDVSKYKQKYQVLVPQKNNGIHYQTKNHLPVQQQRNFKENIKLIEFSENVTSIEHKDINQQNKDKFLNDSIANGDCLGRLVNLVHIREHDPTLRATLLEPIFGDTLVFTSAEAMKEYLENHTFQYGSPRILCLETFGIERMTCMKGEDEEDIYSHMSDDNVKLIFNVEKLNGIDNLTKCQLMLDNRIKHMCKIAQYIEDAENHTQEDGRNEELDVKKAELAVKQKQLEDDEKSLNAEYSRGAGRSTSSRSSNSAGSKRRRESCSGGGDNNRGKKNRGDEHKREASPPPVENSNLPKQTSKRRREVENNGEEDDRRKRSR
jgi:hypothetical protein